jgi:hypothetical protein
MPFLQSAIKTCLLVVTLVHTELFFALVHEPTCVMLIPTAYKYDAVLAWQYI